MRFELPGDLAAILRPELPALADEVGAALRDAGAAFDPQPLRMGIGEGLRQFVDEIELGRRERPRRLFRNFGRTEMRAGRPLEELLAAYRLGGRLAWRRFAAAGRRAGVDAEVLHALAEAIFAWIDELSDQSAEGYAIESRAAASAAQSRRERVVRLLVADPPSEPAAVEAAAGQASWPLPATVAVAAVADEQGRLAAALAPDLLAAPIGELLCVVVPDPDGPGRFAALERLLDRRGAHGALGPTTPWRRASRSWARAAAAHALLERGAIGGAPLVRAADHPELLVLAADPELAAELRDSALAPLAGLTPRQRERFAATLRSWLAHRGSLREIGAELGIHPQTARYRVGRLRELFGDALEDPDGRFRLELALRADALRR